MCGRRQPPAYEKRRGVGFSGAVRGAVVGFILWLAGWMFLKDAI
jgi:hypothetical protein